jgi:hypothetical protein
MAGGTSSRMILRGRGCVETQYPCVLCRFAVSGLVDFAERFASVKEESWV